jgi:hypothetical protein
MFDVSILRSTGILDLQHTHVLDSCYVTIFGACDRERSWEIDGDAGEQAWVIRISSLQVILFFCLLELWRP